MKLEEVQEFALLRCPVCQVEDFFCQVHLIDLRGDIFQVLDAPGVSQYSDRDCGT